MKIYTNATSGSTYCRYLVPSIIQSEIRITLEFGTFEAETEFTFKLSARDKGMHRIYYTYKTGYTFEIKCIAECCPKPILHIDTNSPDLRSFTVIRGAYNQDGRTTNYETKSYNVIQHTHLPLWIARRYNSN